MASGWVSIFVDGRDTRVSLAQPETAGKVPGVLVIMQAFAVHKPIQEVIDKLAREGYVALPPALYHRLGSHPLFSYTGEDAETRTKAMAGPRDAEQVPIAVAIANHAVVVDVPRSIAALARIVDESEVPCADHGSEYAWPPPASRPFG